MVIKGLLGAAPTAKLSRKSKKGWSRVFKGLTTGSRPCLPTPPTPPQTAAFGLAASRCTGGGVGGAHRQGPCLAHG